MASILTPLQINALAGLLQNQGISDTTLAASISTYTSSNLIAPLITSITVGGTGNILTANTINQLETLAANNCPALSDSIPTTNAGSYPVELLTTLLTNTANQYLGNGDVSKFSQALSTAQTYATVTNQVISSTVNSQTYLAGTFTNYNNMISGSITAVNACTELWAQDLLNLGGLIDLSNLNDLGTPIALVKQLAALGGVTPDLTETFITYGVSDDIVVNLTSSELTATTAEQRAMYTAMTHITGNALTQILKILGVKTLNIDSMADLLNPYKIFPNSFQTLTLTNINKVSQNIYINASGTVNSTLTQGLPTVALTALV